MAHKVHKVVIGGLEYKLTSDDETLLRNAIELVNAELEYLEKQSEVKLPLTQLYVLAALNLAEKYSLLKDEHDTDKKYIHDELSKMTELINGSVSN
ncbi:MAG: cell division protein ZapA [Candidatus Kapaibacterium sp.]|jgi:cell division protein ZapA (FtsZ GTPase activity inhibitor)|nr:cell division protein ZapA [Candidatus Kapabacteria bacterium]